jgi:allophanate hydrolase subunit 1
VGLAAGYTAVYPFDAPGGWNLIGRAIDFAPFDPERGARLALGDRVRFEVVP